MTLYSRHLAFATPIFSTPVRASATVRENASRALDFSTERQEKNKTARRHAHDWTWFLLIVVFGVTSAAAFTEKDTIARADAMARAGKAAQAEALLRSAITSAPQSADLHSELGEILLRQGKYESSVQELGTAVQINPDVHRNLILLSEALIGWGHYGVAVDFLHNAESRIGKTPGYHYNLGLAYYSLNQRKEAKAELEEALRLAPDLDRAQFLLASYMADDGNFAGAVQVYRKLVRQHPRDSSYWVALGEGLGEMGAAHEAEASAACRRGLALSPDDSRAQLAMATILIRTGSFTAARPLLERVEKSAPKMLSVHLQLARLYGNLGESELSEKEAAIAKQLQQERMMEDLSNAPRPESAGSESH